jgi:hypothetical protein
LTGAAAGGRDVYDVSAGACLARVVPYSTWEEGIDVLNVHGEALRAAELAEEEA